MQFLVDILPLGSGSLDPHIFADPDPGSQNLADPKDPDPKHWRLGYLKSLGTVFKITTRSAKGSGKISRIFISKDDKNYFFGKLKILLNHDFPGKGNFPVKKL